jgi:hypothetical protein
LSQSINFADIGAFRSEFQTVSNIPMFETRNKFRHMADGEGLVYSMEMYKRADISPTLALFAENSTTLDPMFGTAFSPTYGIQANHKRAFV